MLSYLDPILFPDQCQILEIEPDRFVYPIFKNGSSSLGATGAPAINYFKMREIRTVEIFLRDPFERYVSGVQTYLNNIGPEYDRDTMLTVIGQFLFLNRHFALQFHWIVNLQRYTDAWMHFRPMTELSTATEESWNILTRDQSLVDFFKDNQKLQYYLSLDKILIEDFMGQTVPFSRVVKHIKNKYPTLYDEVIQRSLDICGVLD